MRFSPNGVFFLFSIIVPTYNRAAILARSLECVFSMRGVERCEVLVVDDGSCDETGAVLDSLAARHANLVPLRKENGGPGEARNFGLHRATRQRLLFLDDDIFPDADLLLAHTRALNGSCDVSQGAMVWHEEIAEDKLIRFMDERGMQFRHSSYAAGDKIPYVHVYTANLALTKEHALLAGGFDKAFAVRRYALEDTAFAWRLEAAGRRICYTPQARARHLHPMTEEALLRREHAVGYAMAVAKVHYPELAKDIGFHSIKRFAAVQRLLARLLPALGFTRFWSASFTRRLALRGALLEGAHEARRDMKQARS